MGEVVHRIDRPGVAAAVVAGVLDAVEQRVAHLHVGRGHVDLAAQHVGAVRELAGAHAGEEVEVLLHGPVAVRAGPAGLGDGAPVVADLVLVQAVHVGLAHPDQLDGEAVQPLEVVRGVEQVPPPVEAQPAHVPLNRLDVLQILGLRVGVVVPEVAVAAVLQRQPEVEADRLGVADVEVAVRLRGKARDHPPAVPAGGAVALDHLADEVFSWGGGCGVGHGEVLVGGPAKVSQA